MEEVAFAPLPFLTLFPVSVNQREALRTSDEGGVHLQGCRVSCLVMAPCTWSGVCRTPVGPCWGQQMSACRQTSLDLGFYLWGPCRSLEGIVHVWAAHRGEAQMQRGAGLVPQGPEEGRTSSSHRV